MKEEKARILTLKIPRISKKEAHRRIAKILSEPCVCKRIYTPNPQMALGCARSRELTRIFARADMLLPDGTGLIIASRILKAPLPEIITGIDTAEFILRHASRHSLSVALVGAKPHIAERAAMRLEKRYPTLSVVYTHHGYFKKNGEENERIIKDLHAASPDILFVCFGFPIQEKWIDENAGKLPSLRLCMGLGGALDVWSGNTKRAPKAVRSVCLEWLWRTLGDRKRYRNFSDIAKFLLLVFTQNSIEKH